MNISEIRRLAFEREIAAERAIRNEAKLEVQCLRLRQRCRMLAFYLVAALLAAALSCCHYRYEMEKIRKEFPKSAFR